jgi:hypothetical protein
MAKTQWSDGSDLVSPNVLTGFSTWLTNVQEDISGRRAAANIA